MLTALFELDCCSNCVERVLNLLKLLITVVYLTKYGLKKLIGYLLENLA
jgi:hypothetical protein